jgi:hypothetical protein
VDLDVRERLLAPRVTGTPRDADVHPHSRSSHEMNDSNPAR